MEKICFKRILLILWQEKSVIDIVTCLLKSEKVRLKNKSFEQRDYNVLVIGQRHKDSIQSNSTTRNRLSMQSDSLKDVNTGSKIPNSKD